MYMWFASFRVSVAINLVFLTRSIAYLLLGLGLIGSGHTTVTHWGGYVAIACAVIAWCAAAAHAINGTLQGTILPIVPLTGWRSEQSRNDPDRGRYERAGTSVAGPERR